MLQALINLFKPFKKESVEVKVEDTVKVEALVPEPVAEIKVDSVPEVKPTPVQKPINKGRPKTTKPAAAKPVPKPPRKKK